MSNEKLENIYKLLTEHNFDTNKNFPEEFKCGKCRKILIKACQTRCGCRFCRNCVDEMMNNGCQFCPGITSDCKIELLSTVQLDYRANNQISKLIMKCPEETCSHQCELLKMSEHLRICGKKNLECPFYKMDCDMSKMTYEKLIEHFKLENYNHNETFIDMIDNIKNEVVEMREKELKIHNEIEIMKMEKLEMENRLRNVEELFTVEIRRLKSEHEKEMQSIKSELNDKIEIFKRNFNNKIDEIELKNTEMMMINDGIRLEMMEVCKQTTDKSIMQMGIEQKINQLEINVENNMKGIFEMIINNADELRNKYDGIWSEYFYVRTRPYKLKLNIFYLLFDDELSIRLCIYDDVINQDLPFPFTADVTIKFVNKNKRKLCKSITRYCLIKKPRNNAYNESDKFSYPYSELIKNRILESNCFVVQCCVEFK